MRTKLGQNKKANPLKQETLYFSNFGQRNQKKASRWFAELRKVVSPISLLFDWLDVAAEKSAAWERWKKILSVKILGHSGIWTHYLTLCCWYPWSMSWELHFLAILNPSIVSPYRHGILYQGCHNEIVKMTHAPSWQHILYLITNLIRV